MALPIGGFMPIPLAMMIPFMATQSMVMGDAFGQAFQYGKRKISAMSNEEFNNTSMEQLASQMFKSYQNIIPDLKESIKQSRSLQALIVTELLRLPTSIFQEVVGSTGDARSIREDTGPIQEQPIGTETPEGVIVGYINGVPQYADIPKETISRRDPTPAPPSAPSPSTPAPVHPPTVDPLLRVIDITRRRSAMDLKKYKHSAPIIWWISRLAKDRSELASTSNNNKVMQTYWVSRIFDLSSGIHRETGVWH